MLDDALKDTIQSAYRRWLAARGFAPRRGQRQMVAAIARAFADDNVQARVLAVEAGTGTGKTVAYLLAALPVARARGWRLIISTATLALQEQLVGRDLPDLAASSGLGFSFELAKGRGRFLCPQRLRSRLAEGHSVEGGALNADLFAQELIASQAGSADADAAVELTSAQLEALLEAFVTRRWDGHRDSWPDALAEQAWRPLTTDHRGCTGSRCPEFRQCPYFAARARIADAEVVVANHDLVLADLALGGGAVLPDPTTSMFVFDEAHHLADKAQQHFALEWRVRGSVAWLDGLNPMLAILQQRLGRPPALVAPIDGILGGLPEALALARAVEAQVQMLELQRNGEGRSQHRFVDGVVALALAELAGAVADALRTLVEPLAEVLRFLNSEEGIEAVGTGGNEQLLGAVGNALRRLEHGIAAMSDLAGAARPATERAPNARWIALEGADPWAELVLHSVPVAVDDVLREHLWSRCQGALLTSATLAGLGDFEQLFGQTGLPADTYGLRLASPFDYPNQGALHVPAMRTDGGARDAHTQEIAEQMPELLQCERATLVLFTSWRQLRGVLSALPRRSERMVLCQGELGRTELLARHTAAIDAGKRSAIFGLNSFSEGIDLPGSYCTHVIICKLPFPVPDDPLFASTCEWLMHNGQDPFNTLSVPAAALRLVQACGRLIRSETDRGRITILDRRLVSRRYGRQILEALPPFARFIESQPTVVSAGAARATRPFAASEPPA